MSKLPFQSFISAFQFQFLSLSISLSECTKIWLSRIYGHIQVFTFTSDMTSLIFWPIFSCANLRIFLKHSPKNGTECFTLPHVAKLLSKVIALQSNCTDTHFSLALFTPFLNISVYKQNCRVTFLFVKVYITVILIIFSDY